MNLEEIWKQLEILYCWQNYPTDLIKISSDLFKELEKEEIGNALFWCAENQKWPSIWGYDRGGDYLLLPSNESCRNVPFSWWLEHKDFSKGLDLPCLPKELYEKLHQMNLDQFGRKDYPSVRTAIEDLAKALEEVEL